jgi:hypothetical protein
MRINLWGAAGVAAALVGCGPSSGEPPDGGEESSGPAEELEIYDFFIAAETSYCGWAAKCGAFASADECMKVEFFDVQYPADLLAAGTFHRESGGSLVKYVMQAYSAGRIEFDAEAAASCLAYVESRGCDRAYTYAPSEEEVAGRKACASVFRGTMTRNGPCLLSLECAHEEGETALCGVDFTDCTDACCVGGCRVLIPGKLGEACNNTTGCQAGSYCASDPMTGNPTVCAAVKPIGQACSNSSECEATAYCDFINAVCAKRAAPGASCYEAECEAGSYCGDVSPDFSGDYRCLKYGQVGEPCARYSSGCKSLTAVCDGDQLKCVELPKTGSPCSQWSNEGNGCAPSASCDWQTNTCVANVGEGEACGYMGDDFGGKYVACQGALLCTGDTTQRCEVPQATSACAVPELQPLPGEG